MPRASVWIRNDDWDKWQLIDNKVELISQAINRSEIQMVTRKGVSKLKQTIPHTSDEPEIIIDPETNAVTNMRSNSYEAAKRGAEYIKKTFCPKGHYLGDSGKCLQKSCKYA